MRKNTGITVSKEELNSIRLISNRLLTTSTMMHTIPEDVNPEDMDKYVASIVKSRSEVIWLEGNWWELISNKYGILVNSAIFIDFMNGELFREEKE